MKKILTIIFSALFLFQGAAAAFANFSDVKSDNSYYEDIKYIEDAGIIQGNTFSPDDKITREDFAKWILNNDGFTGENYKPKSKLRFIDVPVKNNSYAPFIYKLTDLGLFTKSQKGLFKPKNRITKLEALKWIFFVEGIPVPQIFDEKSALPKDVNKNSANAPLVYKAMKLGMIESKVAQLNKFITRKEAARLLKIARENAPTVHITFEPTSQSDIERNPKFDIMVGVWNKIFESYLQRDNVDKNNLVYGAIDGMLKELGDKHTDFERPGDNSLIESLSGEVEGIGAVLQMKDDEPSVITPIVGSPAEKAGLAPNDVITAVDGVETKGMSLTNIVKRIKGKKGTQVKLTIRRGTQVLTLNIIRDIVTIVSASVKFTDDNIAQITLTDFGEKTDSEFKNIVGLIKSKNPKGIIIDLRNNPGGFLNTAINIAGYFINSGERVTSVKYPDHEEPQNSHGQAELASYKMAVVVNGGSASASEILAGALQDYGLAKVIGETTYGKGTVQELADFPDGSTLKLTIAEWLTPKGRTIEKAGIAPDIVMKLTDADRTAGKDPQMDRALLEIRK